MQIPFNSKKDIVVTGSKIASSQNPFASQTLDKAKADLSAATSDLVKAYIGFKDSDKQLQIDNYKAEYTKRLQGVNAEFMDKVKSGQIKPAEITTAYQNITSDDFDEYAKTINLTLTGEQKTLLQDDFKKIVKENFENNISKQLVANEKQTSKENLEKTVANTNDMASMGLAGISQIKAIYDSPDFNKIGTLHYQADWPEQKKSLQSTSFSHFYNKLADELFENYDEVRLTRLNQLISSDKAITPDDKQQLLIRTDRLKDMAIGSKVADKYLSAGVKEGYKDSATINQLIEGTSRLTKSQKLYAQHIYARNLEKRREEIQADYLVKRNDAWSTIFATGDYLNVDPLLFDTLDETTKNKMRSYKTVTKTDLTSHSELLYKVMNSEKVDVLDQGYQDLTLYDLQTLQQRQAALNNDPVQQKQATKICQQIDDALGSINITEKRQKINLFGLIMDEIDGQQRTQKQPLTAGQINEAIQKVLPSTQKAVFKK